MKNRVLGSFKEKEFKGSIGTKSQVSLKAKWEEFKGSMETRAMVNLKRVWRNRALLNYKGAQGTTAAEPDTEPSAFLNNLISENFTAPAKK